MFYADYCGIHGEWCILCSPSIVVAGPPTLWISNLVVTLDGMLPRPKTVVQADMGMKPWLFGAAETDQIKSVNPISSLGERRCIVTPMAAAGTEPMQQNHRGSFGITEHAPVTAAALPGPYSAFAPIGTVGGRLKSSCVHTPDGVERSLSRRDGVGADRGWFLSPRLQTGARPLRLGRCLNFGGCPQGSPPALA